MPEQPPVHIDFWFDPACPFAWRTSRWALEVAEHRALEVAWHVMSLAVLNGVDDPQAGIWKPVRVCIAAERAHGSEVLLPLYTALGRRIHDDGRRVDGGLIEEALAEAALPVELKAAAEETGLDAAVRAAHREGQEAAEEEVGTPVVRLEGQRAFFGPVVSSVPRGQEALDLFDGLRLMGGVDVFAELKRGRHELSRPTGVAGGASRPRHAALT